MTDTLDEALRAEDAGVDGVVLGGAEKGGGNGRDNLHSFALLQKARRRLSVPIVASGGIADGYGMAAAFALGAEGVMMERGLSHRWNAPGMTTTNRRWSKPSE